MTLRAVGKGEPTPNAGLLALAEELLARVKSGEVIGAFCVLEVGLTGRETLLGGELDPDGIAGYSARVLAAVADGA